MVHKIDKKIVGYRVVVPGAEPSPAEPTAPARSRMHEGIVRPDALSGTTYKVKVPQYEEALYITINDFVLDAGTDLESRHPYEIFVNSKNMDSFQWIVAITRMVSGIFRKGGDVKFVIEEMKAVFDPRGGYYRKGVYIPSVVAEIGYVIEKHLTKIGLFHVEQLSEDTLKFIEEKKSQIADMEFPPQSTLCPKCQAVSVVVMDGCATCLNCGDSKCG